MASINVVKMASKFDISDSFIVIPQDAWAKENGFSIGDLVDIDGQTFKIDDFYEAQTDSSGEAIISDEVQMNKAGRGRFYSINTTPPDSFFATMSQFGTTDIHLRQATSSTWEELSDEFACRVSWGFAARFDVSRFDRIEITEEGGNTETFGIYEMFSEPSSAEDVIRMGGSGRDRLGLFTRSEDISSVTVLDSDWDLIIENGLSDWKETGTDPFSVRVSEWFKYNDYYISGTPTKIEPGDFIEVDDENEDGYFGVHKYHQQEYVRPTIRVWQGGRDRITAFEGDTITIDELNENDIPVYIYFAETTWEGVGDEYTMRPSVDWEQNVDTNFDTLYIDDMLYGWVTEHNLDNTISTFRMGQNARDRLGVTAKTDYFYEDGWNTYDETELPIILEKALVGWDEVGDKYGAQAPLIPSTANRRFYNVEVVSTGTEKKYGVGNRHDAFHGIPLFRMGQSARDRLGDPVSLVGERVNIQITANEPRPLIDFADTAWDNVGDEFAVRLSPYFDDRYNVTKKETNFEVESDQTGESNYYGYWEEHTKEVYWPVIRMGSNARERIGSPDVETKCDFTVSDRDVIPRADFGRPTWSDEIGNALLVAVSDYFADRTGVGVGDFIKLTHEENRRERVFRVNRISSLDFDRMDSTMRMGFWGRYRFFEEGNGETVKDEFPLRWEPYDEEAQEFKHVGVGQSLIEWDFADVDEQIAIPPQILSDLNIDAKYDSPPETDAERGFENANSQWDNLRLMHADYGDDRYAAYTAWAEYTPNSYPKIRMSSLAREKLNDPGRDDEVDRVPNTFVVRVNRDVPNQEYTTPKSAYNRRVFNGEAYHRSDSAEWGQVVENHRILMLAHHGGWIEIGTSPMAQIAANFLNSSIYLHEGRRRGGGSFDRWHITSADFDQGFPELQKHPRDYDYSVSFQGWGNDYALIGGRAPQSFRATYRDDYLGPALPDDLDLRVYGLDSQPEDENFAGTNKLNITNRYTKNFEGGIQIEFPRTIRENYYREIGQSTARFFINELDTLYK